MDGEDVFANVVSEGTKLDIDKTFDRLDAKDKGENPTESQPVKKTTDSPSQKGKSTSSEEKTPFHKHPRWIKTQETLKQYESRIAEFEKKVQDFEKGKKEVSLPKWWADVYGDSDDSKKRFGEYETATQGERERLRDEIKSDLKQEVEQEQSQAKEGEQYVSDQLAEMADEGLKFERNKLLKFMVDFQSEYGAGSLLDANGNYDFRKALKLQQQIQPDETNPQSITRKNLASNSNRSKVSSQSSSTVPTVSRHALRKGGWREALK